MARLEIDLEPSEQNRLVQSAELAGLTVEEYARQQLSHRRAAHHPHAGLHAWKEVDGEHEFDDI